MVAGVLVSGSPGIVINVDNNTYSNPLVVLRGLSIEGLGTGTYGIRVLSGGRIIVEHCTIQNFAQHGIDFEPSSAAQLIVSDSTLDRNNAAILLQAGASATATATVSGSNLVHNKTGILLNKGTATARNTTFSGNTLSAINATGDGTRANVDDSTISDNGVGVTTFGSQSAVYLSRTAITGNNTGIQALGGTVYSFGNNRIFGNANAGSSPTPTPEQ
jgi:hypothetical protein